MKCDHLSTLVKTSDQPLTTMGSSPYRKNPPANAGDAREVALIPGPGRSPRAGNGNPLQYSCLENPMDRGAWQPTVHGVIKSWTPLSAEHAHRHHSEMRPSITAAFYDMM